MKNGRTARYMPIAVKNSAVYVKTENQGWPNQNQLSPGFVQHFLYFFPLPQGHC